ncbi:hypothetical protein FF100_15540 [Methylobacterium terricola]|uniref:Short chain enoyl-CoA hydratase n=1 Tax=Methylobacterium terricola TaxID=2583531 RepID=A0A5C4LI57_9HYPH|nr:enoyl-CoA hydratase-related protein [Methylobacterium terricola]TNC13020.1 hypothetical protein FF100_15540 [Methylobacterium terricola]
MSESAAIVTVEGPLAWITLNRPDDLNAMSPALIEDLDQAVTAVEQDPRVRVVAITGRGRAFSAGGDLKSFRDRILAGNLESFHAGLRRGQEVFRRIETLPLPVIASVNGYAIAGGLELVLACDLVVAAAGARMGDGHAKFGVIPGAGGSVRLPRKIPVALAKQLLFTAELVPAETLRGWGLVNEVVPDAELPAAVTALAGRIAKASPLTLRVMKGLVDGGLDTSIEEALEAELTAFRRYAESHDLREGLSAFEEKRQPRFRGE